MLDLRLDIDLGTGPDVLETVTAELHQAGTDAERDIEAAWPFKTGRSRRGWTLRRTRDGFDLDNSTPYTAFVKGGEAIVDRVLGDVTEATVERLADSLPPAILSEVNHG